MIILLSILSAILYRLGGMYNTKIRDLGVPIIGLITIHLLGIKAPAYIHIIAFLLYFSSLTTYWDSVCGYDNFYMHGYACSLAYIPYAIINGHYIDFLARCLICTLQMGLINRLVNKYSVKYSDWIEELSRGFILNITLILLKFST